MNTYKDTKYNKQLNSTDIVILLKKEADIDMCTVKYYNKPREYKIPYSYIKPIYKVLYDYTGGTSNIKEGDVVIKEKEDTDGWCSILKLPKDIFVPCSYIDQLKEVWLKDSNKKVNKLKEEQLETLKTIVTNRIFGLEEEEEAIFNIVTTSTQTTNFPTITIENIKECINLGEKEFTILISR